MNPLEIYCKKAMEMGLDGAKIIGSDSIATAEWVRLKCQFGCPGYGMRLSCPPHTPAPEITRKVIDSYRLAILLHRKLRKGERSSDFSEIVVRLEKEIFLDGFYKAWSMGSGPCRLCKECNVSGPCKHGDQARPSMEACGIDVFKTARDNGFQINVLRRREDERNSYGLILVE